MGWQIQTCAAHAQSVSHPPNGCRGEAAAANAGPKRTRLDRGQYLARRRGYLALVNVVEAGHGGGVPSRSGPPARHLSLVGQDLVSDRLVAEMRAADPGGEVEHHEKGVAFLGASDSEEAANAPC